MKMQRLLSYVRRAVQDYDMIQDGDRIAVGISGGKDSLTLLMALKGLQRFYPKKFEIEAITVSLGFEGMDFSPIQKFCDELGVHYSRYPDWRNYIRCQKGKKSLCLMFKNAKRCFK